MKTLLPYGCRCQHSFLFWKKMYWLLLVTIKYDGIIHAWTIWISGSKFTAFVSMIFPLGFEWLSVNNKLLWPFHTAHLLWYHISIIYSFLIQLVISTLYEVSLRCLFQALPSRITSTVIVKIHVCSRITWTVIVSDVILLHTRIFTITVM
jgi:hypothetical protein